MGDLLKLADRVEALDGPDREVDVEVALCTGWENRLGAKQEWLKPNGFASTEGPPYFTASLDAAMTLVPDGWLWEVGNYAAKGDATVTHPNYNPDTYNGIQVWVEAKTPALALCAAALRARSKDGDEWAKFRLLVKDYRRARQALKETIDRSKDGEN